MRYRILEHGLVDSTSERAFAELEAGGARHGDVHLAHGQTGGRGRLGRRWHSPPGEGLYMSVVLLPPPPAPRPATLTMAFALAVHGALSITVAERLRIDWPNDVVAGRAKLAGILVESRGLDPARPHYVAGIGVNVRQREFPAELLAERAVTSLAILGSEVSPPEVAEAVLERIPARLAADPRELAADFLAACGLAGVEAHVQAGRERWRGRVRALEPREGLLLDLEEGGELRVPLELVGAIEPIRG